MRTFQDTITILSAVAATGLGTVIEVSDFTHLEVLLATANNATLTVKLVGSNALSKPDFTAAATPANPWSYIQMIDLNDQSVINGATGVAYTGTDSTRMFEANINALKWASLIVTAYSGGNLTGQVMPFSNQ